MLKKISLFLICSLLATQVFFVSPFVIAEESNDENYCMDMDFSKYEDGTPMSTVMDDFPNVFPAIDSENTYKGKLRFGIEDGLLKVYSMVPADTGVALDHFVLTTSQFGLSSGSYYVEVELAANSKKYMQMIIESTINSSSRDMTCSDVYAGNQMRVKLEGSNVGTKYEDDGSVMTFTQNQVVGVRYLINLDERQIDGLWMKSNEDLGYRQALVDGQKSFAYRRADVTNSATTPGIGSVKFGAATGGACAADELIYTIKHVRIWESEESILSRAASKLSTANMNIAESGVVSDNLTLPDSLEEFPGVNITWESDKSDIISSDGSVTLPEENTEVTITATLEKNGVKLVKSMNLLVRGKSDAEYILFYETFPDASSLKKWRVINSGGTVKANDGLTMTKTGNDASTPVITRDFGNTLFRLNTEVTTELVWAASNENESVSATIKSSDGTDAAKAQFRADDTGYDLSYIYAPDGEVPRPVEEYAHNTVEGEGTMVNSKCKIDVPSGQVDFWFNNVQNPSQTVYTLNPVSDIAALTIGFDGTNANGGVLEVKSVKASVPNAKRLEMNAEQLVWEMLSQQDQSEVTFLTLPTEGTADVKIEWTSSDQNAVTNEGVVSRSYSEQSVKLTAKLYKAEAPSESVTKSFDIKIKPLDAGNLAYQKPVSSNISASGNNVGNNVTDGSYATSFTSAGTERTGFIRVDLGEVQSVSEVRLYENTVNDSYKIKGYTVQVSENGTTWTDVASADEIGAGKTIRFAPRKARFVQINITSKESGPFSLSEFEIYFDSTDADIVGADLERLKETTGKWPYIVSNSLSLPTSGVFGSTISWSSDHPEIIDKTGEFISKPSKDTIVVLTAEIKFGSATQKTTFRCLVEGKNSSGSSGSTGGGGGGSSSSSSSSRVTGGMYIPVRTDVPDNNDKLPESSPEPSDEPSNGITDVPQTDEAFSDLADVPWAVEAINALYDEGIVSGDGSGMFYPQRKVTREEFTKMLVVWLGLDSPENPSLPFEDCAAEGWYYGYLAAAYENGLISGIDNKTFGLGQSITRQDMSVILYRAISKYETLPEALPDVSEFEDSNEISSYAMEGVEELHSRGVLNGDGGYFRPRDYATRSEVAVMLHRLTD